MKSFSKPTVPECYDKAYTNRVLVLTGSSLKTLSATIFAADSYIQAKVNFYMLDPVHGNLFLELKFT